MGGLLVVRYLSSLNASEMHPIQHATTQFPSLPQPISPAFAPYIALNRCVYQKLHHMSGTSSSLSSRTALVRSSRLHQDQLCSALSLLFSPDPAHIATLTEFMNTVASSLETFTLIRGKWTWNPSWPLTFPRLCELTLIDPSPDILRLPLSSTPLFPALTHLHVVEHSYVRPVDLCHWAAHAPQLTHLRCSGLNHQDSLTARSLAVISGTSISHSVCYQTHTVMAC